MTARLGNAVFLGLGSNRSGPWGSRAETLERGLEELQHNGVLVRRVSSFYETQGVGPGRRTVFVNAVCRCDCHCAPEVLLRRLKRLERGSGGRSAMPWAPRTLDLDILAFKGRVDGWVPDCGYYTLATEPWPSARLTIPHPRLHLRPFVLVPLSEIAPAWRHPVFGLTAGEMMKRLGFRTPGQILNRLPREA